MKTKTDDFAVLEFTKAFDKVPHKRLIHKVKHYGIRGHLAEWLSSFLTSRVQSVVVDSKSSSSASVLSGVPQGTVLGPLMFLLYINDLPDQLTSSCRLFADDCLVYNNISSEPDVGVLQRDLHKLEEWQGKWLMSFNPKKCSTITFASSQAPRREYAFCGETMTVEENTTYLGIQLSSNLNWSVQTKNAVNKAQKILGLIRRNMWGCTEKVKIIAYQALVRPHLEYAIGAWCPYRMKDIKSMERIQRQAARFCKKNYTREPGVVTGILDTLGWETLQDRRTAHRLTLMYKIRNGQIDVNMEDRLQINHRSTRGHDQKFREPSVRLDVYKFSYFPDTIKLWNKLPAFIIQANTPSTFKSAVLSYLGGSKSSSSL
jgi:hypothetical protein